MRRNLRTYTGYSIGLAVAWAVVLLLVWGIDPPTTQRHVVFVFLGFAIGWVSATIARYIYPPPKKYLRDAGSDA